MCDFLYYRKKYCNTKNPLWDNIKTELKTKRSYVAFFFECLIDISASNLLDRGHFVDVDVVQASYLTEIPNKKGFQILDKLIEYGLVEENENKYSLTSFDKYNPKFNNIQGYENAKPKDKEDKIPAKTYHNWYHNIASKVNKNKPLTDKEYDKLEKLQEYFKNDLSKFKNIQEFLRISQEDLRISQEDLRQFKNDNITDNKITDNKITDKKENPLTPLTGGNDCFNQNEVNSKSFQLEKQFSEFWEVYPKKTSKIGAKKQFKSALKSRVEFQDLLNGAKKYKTFCEQNKTEYKYIKHPETWLNKGCWEDELNVNTKCNKPKLFDLYKSLDKIEKYHFYNATWLLENGYTQADINAFVSSVSIDAEDDKRDAKDYLNGEHQKIAGRFEEPLFQYLGFKELPPEPPPPF